MQEFNIKGNTIVTAQLKTQIDDSPLALPPPSGYESIENFQAMADAQDSSTDALKNNTALLKEFGDILPEILRNFRAMNDTIAKTNQNLPSTSRITASQKTGIVDGQAQRTLDQLVNSGGNIAQRYINADVGGMATSALSGAKNVVGGLQGMASSNGLEGIASALGPAAAVLGVAAIVGGVANTLSNKYMDAAPTIFGSGRAFGGMSDRNSMFAYETLARYNRGTGLDTDEFQALAQGLSRNGMDNIYTAGSVARTAGRWAYATGGDANQYAELAGMMSRYGGSRNVGADFNYLMGAGRASGLNDTQLPEFLSGIQKVMEEGIAKGFSRSATEVADTLLMFSKMSGNSAFWQGEQGAKMLSQANAGIAGATALNSTEHILAYAAYKKTYDDAALRQKLGVGKNGAYVEGSTYGNVMAMMEGGLTPESFQAIMESNMFEVSIPDLPLNAIVLLNIKILLMS